MTTLPEVETKSDEPGSDYMEDPFSFYSFNRTFKLDLSLSSGDDDDDEEQGCFIRAYAINRRTKHQYLGLILEEHISKMTKSLFEIDVFFALLEGEYKDSMKGGEHNNSQSQINVVWSQEKMPVSALKKIMNYEASKDGVDGGSKNVQLQEQEEVTELESDEENENGMLEDTRQRRIMKKKPVRNSNDEKIEVLKLTMLYYPLATNKRVVKKYPICMVKQPLDPLKNLELRMDDVELGTAALVSEQSTVARAQETCYELETQNGWKMLVSLELPNERGSYILRYSTRVMAPAGLVRYSVRLGGTQVDNGKLLDPPSNNAFYVNTSNSTSHFVPLYGMVIVDLDGKESKSNRTVLFYGYGDSEHKNKFHTTILEYQKIGQKTQL